MDGGILFPVKRQQVNDQNVTKNGISVIWDVILSFLSVTKVFLIVPYDEKKKKNSQLRSNI